MEAKVCEAEREWGLTLLINLFMEGRQMSTEVVTEWRRMSIHADVQDMKKRGSRIKNNGQWRAKSDRKGVRITPFMTNQGDADKKRKVGEHESIREERRGTWRVGQVAQVSHIHNLRCDVTYEFDQYNGNNRFQLICCTVGRKHVDEIL